MSKATLLYNPAAGRRPLSLRRLNRVLELLHGMGVAADAVATKPRGCMTPLDLGGKDLLIVWGGDGSIHDAIPEAVKWRVPLAVLPAGTANVLAREIGIPRVPERALRLIAAGKTRRLRLGRGCDEYFHLMAGVGPDGHVIRNNPGPLKKTLGVGSYWLAGLRAFRNLPLKPFEALLDGGSHRATFAVVSKSRYYGGHLLVAPQASVFDGLLDVCLFQATDRWSFLRYLYGAFNGKHVRFPDVVYRRTERVEVLGDETIPIQMDGDVVGHLPMAFTCEDGIEVFAP